MSLVKNKEVIEYLNKSNPDHILIADFMGIKKVAYTYGYIKWYETEWNWLIPVVQKIKSLNLEDKSATDKIDFYLTGVNKKETFNSCVEFIKWYNELS
jgi:hypothetical protein